MTVSITCWRLCLNKALKREPFRTAVRAEKPGEAVNKRPGVGVWLLGALRGGGWRVGMVVDFVAEISLLRSGG